MTEIDVANDLVQINQQLEQLVIQLNQLNIQREQLTQQIYNLNGIVMYLRGQESAVNVTGEVGDLERTEAYPDAMLTSDS